MPITHEWCYRWWRSRSSGNLGMRGHITTNRIKPHNWMLGMNVCIHSFVQVSHSKDGTSQCNMWHLLFEGKVSPVVLDISKKGLYGRNTNSYQRCGWKNIKVMMIRTWGNKYNMTVQFIQCILLHHASIHCHMGRTGCAHLVRTIEQLEVLPYPVQAELNTLAAAGAQSG